MRRFDVIVVGGGPAGLSAALMLGRCRRSVLVCDAGNPRNAASRALHGYLTRDGIPPLELLTLGRGELERYGVEFLHVAVTRAIHRDGVFEVTLGDGSAASARKLLLATGVVDLLPRIPGIDACYGISIFHCPYCDGWEVRDLPLAVYGRGRRGAGLSLSLKTWSDDVVLCTDGGTRFDPEDKEALDDAGIPVRVERIEEFEHRDGRLERIRFAGGDSLDRSALFFNTGQHLRSDLAASLGCRMTHRGVVKTDRLGDTGVADVYVVGDASKDVQLAVVAASEGVKAAFAINTAFQQEARAESLRSKA